MAIIDFFRVIFAGLWQMVQYLLQGLQKFFGKLPFWEKLNLLFSFLCLVLLLQAWRGYDIALVENQPIFHRIYSDDFLLFIIFFVISLLPVLFFFADYYAQNRLKHFALAMRVGGLGTCTVLYILNVISPSRVAPTTEASFTWQFYLFGFLLLLNFLVGYMGIKLMPNTRLRSE